MIPDIYVRYLFSVKIVIVKYNCTKCQNHTIVPETNSGEICEMSRHLVTVHFFHVRVYTIIVHIFRMIGPAVPKKRGDIPTQTILSSQIPYLTTDRVKQSTFTKQIVKCYLQKVRIKRTRGPKPWSL